MKAKAHLFSISNNLDSLLAALSGFFLIQLFAKHSGVGVSPDSVTYISACRHLIQGTGFRSFDLLPVVDFPCAYPFFLTIISFFTRLDPLQFGAVLNGILFGILLYCSGALMNGLEHASGWYKRILLLCILLSPALQEVYSMLWSETVFLLLILVFIPCMALYLRGRTVRWLLICSFLCALICLTRYAGIFLIISGAVLIILNGKQSLGKRIADGFVFGFISFCPLLINMLRNFWATGLATGIRPKSEVNLLTILEYFGGVLSDWLLIDRKPGISILLAVLVFVIFSVSIFRTRKKKSGQEFLYVAAVLGLTYCGFLLVTYSITRYEPFTNRLLAPIFIPLLWSVSSWIPGYFTRAKDRMTGIVCAAMLLVAACFINLERAADWEYYDGVKDAGIPGYREDPFLQSGIVQFLENNKSIFDGGHPVYSNAGDAFYFVTGKPSFQLPFLDFPNQVQHYYTRQYPGPGGEFLVWFQNEEDLQMPTLDQILKNKNMELIKQLPDGAVYVTK
jgi:hypothetical protein